MLGVIVALWTLDQMRLDLTVGGASCFLLPERSVLLAYIGRRAWCWWRWARLLGALFATVKTP
jgi:hypothetical protein